MIVILGLIRLGVGLLALGLGAAAIAAWFGFAVPFFDLFNHLQVLLIAGSLIALIGVLVLFGGSGFRWPLVALLCIGLLASAITVGPETIAAFAQRPPPPIDGRPVIKLMTHNLFGLNYDMERVRKIIAAENPDIIALQEYFPEQRGPLDPMLKGAYPYAVLCTGGKRANIALYSKLPFEPTRQGACDPDAAPGTRIARIIGSFTLGDGSKFSVLTTHLDWPFPMERQEQQLGELAAAVEAAPTPLLLVGDFNSTPWSYAQRAFATTAGLTRQTHGIITFPMRWWLFDWFDSIPVLPLDQVLSKGDITLHELRTGPATGSDHLPLVVRFSVEPPTASPR